MPQRKRQFERRDFPKLERLAGDGLDERAIAGEFAMTLADLKKAIRKDPNAEIRMNRGRALHQRRVLSRLHEILDGKGGQNVVAGIYLSKAVHKWTDRPPPQRPETNVTVVVPQALSEAEFRRRVEARVEPRQIEGEVTDDA